MRTTDTQAMQALLRAIQRDTLPHALLLKSASNSALGEAAQTLALSLLGERAAQGNHPDLIESRPAGRLRRIGVEEIRDLIRQISLSPMLGGKRLVIIHEADRLQIQAANAFLKTLEEPPAGTTLLLLSTRPRDLPGTILSRCQAFRIPGSREDISHPAWLQWMQDFRQWLEQIAASKANGQTRPAAAMPIVFGLLCRLEGLAETLPDALASTGNKADENITDEEKAAREAGLKRQIRQQFLEGVGNVTREFALADKTGSRLRGWLQLSDEMERCTRLMDYNVGEMILLEHLMLGCLRTWGGAGVPTGHALSL